MPGRRASTGKDAGAELTVVGHSEHAQQRARSDRTARSATRYPLVRTRKKGAPELARSMLCREALSHPLCQKPFGTRIVIHL